MASPLQGLADKQAIAEQMARYCQAIDRCDADILLSVFHPGARCQMGVFDGPAEEFAAAIIPYLKTTLVTATHRVTNLWIRVEGERAVAESYMWGYAFDQAYGVSGQPSDIPDGMRYADVWEKRDGLWKMTLRKLIMDWNACWPHSGNDADGLYAQLNRGRRDRDDASYAAGLSHS